MYLKIFGDHSLLTECIFMQCINEREISFQLIYTLTEIQFTFYFLLLFLPHLWIKIICKTDLIVICLC